MFVGTSPTFYFTNTSGWNTSSSNNNSNNKYDDDDHDTDSRRNINGIHRIHNGTLTGLVTPCVNTALENKGQDGEEDLHPSGLTQH